MHMHMHMHMHMYPVEGVRYGVGCPRVNRTLLTRHVEVPVFYEPREQSAPCARAGLKKKILKLKRRVAIPRAGCGDPAALLK